MANGRSHHHGKDQYQSEGLDLGEVLAKQSIEPLPSMKYLTAETIVHVGRVMGKFLAGRVEDDDFREYREGKKPSEWFDTPPRGIKSDAGKKKELKTAQIRKVLDAVRRIKHESKSPIREKSMEAEEEQKQFDPAFFRERCLFLKPQLAYSSGRKPEVKPLYSLLRPCVDKIHDEEDFLKFFKLVESIIAYHKFNGGE